MSTYVSPWMDEELSIFETRSRALSKPKWCRTMSTGESSSTWQDIWRKAGEMGLLCIGHIADYGGLSGGDFDMKAILYEETREARYFRIRPGRARICADYLENHGTRNRAPLPAAHGQR